MPEKQAEKIPGCEGPSPSALLTAARQFNAGEYFACHETLEELWLAEAGRVRTLYQGILQVGVGLYHLRRGNRQGALTLLRKGTDLLRPFTPACLGVDVEALVKGAEKVLAAVQRLDIEAMQAPFPRISFTVRQERKG